MESFNAEVSGNLFADNKYGIRLSVGCGDNVFSDNVVTNSTRLVSLSTYFDYGYWYSSDKMS